MALDTFSRIANQVRMRCPTADILLAQDWVNHAFRQVVERRHWSWRMKFGQFISPALVNAGTITATTNSNIVTGSGTAWDTTFVGRQFRVGLGAPIYTIQSVQSATQLTLDNPWGYVNVAAVGYQIYQAYFTVPSDFLTFLTVYDPRLNWRLNLNVTQEEINAWDAQRANVGNVYAVVSRDYSTLYAGSIGSPVQIIGSGAVPQTTGVFSGPASALYTIQIQTGGAIGTATYQWKVNNGAFSLTVTTDANGNAQTLSQGVQVYFPAGTYNANDVFVIACQAIPQVGLPRFELWPHYQNNYVWPFMYIAIPPDLEDSGAVLPRTLRGDVLLELAMAEAANWPGPSPEKRNPYYNPGVMARHERRAENLIQVLELQDDNIFEQDASYSYFMGLPFAPFPFGDAAWLQTHDPPAIGY